MNAEKNETKKEILYLYLDILKGVGFMHYNNMIHRDLKPGNIFLKSKEKEDSDYNMTPLTIKAILGDP